MDVTFYGINSATLEHVVPRLVEKIYKIPLKTVVIAQDDIQCERLNTLLWTYSTKAFIPHGSTQEGGDLIPHLAVWLTTVIENPLQAEVCLVCAPMVVKNHDFQRISYIICEDDPRFQESYQQAQHYHQTYQTWYQTPQGWEKR